MNNINKLRVLYIVIYNNVYIYNDIIIINKIK